MWMWELDHKEGRAPKNWCFRTVVPEKDLRVPWTAKGSSQSMPKKSTLNIHWKDWCWNWSSNPLDTWCEEPTQWKRLMLRKFECRKRRGRQRMRRLSSIIGWTWVWDNSWRQWRTGKPGVLQFMGSQRVISDSVTEHQQQWAAKVHCSIKRVPRKIYMMKP